MLAAWSPPFHKLSDTPHSFRPEQKFSVPSIGSKTATHPSAENDSATQLSSPCMTRPDNRAVRKSDNWFSTKRSAAVTGLPSGFQRISDLRAIMSGIIAITAIRTSQSSARISLFLEPVNDNSSTTSWLLLRKKSTDDLT